ncbi:hypothetical protein MA16_Dca004564 [Dendrobium catenatum]|uniref:Uncharacterized protein n=1 Tax=Dendrobium catenatum TaxID=906689 RepID=A0A2I0VNF8_9ASPA|nr:hypothetical protein MA16_Dca004564 [Dendrobium catenatum]
MGDHYFDGVTNYIKRLLANCELNSKFVVPSYYFREYPESDNDKESECARVTNK